jgi:outer membrane protein
MRRIVIIAIVLGVCTQAATAEEQKTLAECIAIAIAQHPSLKAATASVQAGGQRVREAAASYLPQLTASYGATRQRSSVSQRTSSQSVGPGANTFNFYNTGVGFTQLLFDFGQTLNSIRAAQAAEQSLAANRSTQQDTVVLNVKQAYFNVLATRRLLSVADETVRQNQKHLEQAQARFSVGLAAKFDVTQAQVQLAQAELNQLTARNNLAVARETLRNAMGLTTALDFAIVDNFDVQALQITEDKALALAYEQRPELQSIQAQERSTIEQIAALEKNYLPNITSNGRYQWSASDYPLQSSWNVGATVNLSIFNGGLTTAQVGEQKANLANLKYNEEVQRQDIALEVRQDVLNLQQAEQSIHVAAKGRAQARENLDLAEGRYKTGVGNIIELTDAQASLTTAEANYVQALYNYKTSVAALEKATAQALATD